MLLQHRQQLFDPLFETRIVATRRIFATTQLSERNRALRQAFEDEIIEVTALRENSRGVETIAGEPRTAADTQPLLH